MILSCASGIIKCTYTFIHFTTSQWAQAMKIVGKCKDCGFKCLKYMVVDYKVFKEFSLTNNICEAYNT